MGFNSLSLKVVYPLRCCRGSHQSQMEGVRESQRANPALWRGEGRVVFLVLQLLLGPIFVHGRGQAVRFPEIQELKFESQRPA